MYRASKASSVPSTRKLKLPFQRVVWAPGPEHLMTMSVGDGGAWALWFCFQGSVSGLEGHRMVGLLARLRGPPAVLDQPQRERCLVDQVDFQLQGVKVHVWRGCVGPGCHAGQQEQASSQGACDCHQMPPQVVELEASRCLALMHCHLFPGSAGGEHIVSKKDRSGSGCVTGVRPPTSVSFRDYSSPCC